MNKVIYKLTFVKHYFENNLGTNAIQNNQKFL